MGICIGPQEMVGELGMCQIMLKTLLFSWEKSFVWMLIQVRPMASLRVILFLTARLPAFARKSGPMGFAIPGVSPLIVKRTTSTLEMSGRGPLKRSTFSQQEVRGGRIMGGG